MFSQEDVCESYTKTKTKIVHLVETVKKHWQCDGSGW